MSDNYNKYKFQPAMVRPGSAEFMIKEELDSEHSITGNNSVLYNRGGTITAPPLLNITDKTAPPGITLYVQIDIQNGRPPITGIYVPPNFSQDEPTDLIIYLHGHMHHVPPPDTTINRYWDRDSYNKIFALREEVYNSGRKNVIFAAPTLSKDSEYGILGSNGQFDNYINKIISALNNHIFFMPFMGLDPTKVNIILAAHSGGGRAMLNITQLKDYYSTKIKECWAFDSMYSFNIPHINDVNQAWLNWAASHASSFLYIHYSEHAGTKHNSCSIQNANLKNVCVQKTTSKWSDIHDSIPVTHLKERLLQVSCNNNNNNCTILTSRTTRNHEFDYLNTEYELATEDDIPPPLKSDSSLYYKNLKDDRDDIRFFEFKRKVYEEHIKSANKCRNFIPSLPADQIEPWKEDANIQIHVRMTLPLMQLLRDARNDAAKMHRHITIGAISLYRTPEHQMWLWDKSFLKHYNYAIKKGVIEKGDFSKATAAALAHFIGGVLAAPGYSNHAHGRAVDFGVPTDGGFLKRTDWFWHWLNNNAWIYAFVPYPKEPWHWEYWGDMRTPEEIKTYQIPRCTKGTKWDVPLQAISSGPILEIQKEDKPVISANDTKNTLFKLGYIKGEPITLSEINKPIILFQKDLNIKQTGTLDSRTIRSLVNYQNKISILQSSLRSFNYLSRFRITNYYVAEESDPSNQVIPVLDHKGNTLANVSPSFFISMSIEGTGKLLDGRLINVDGRRLNVLNIDSYNLLASPLQKYFKPENYWKTGIEFRNGKILSVLTFYITAQNQFGRGYGVTHKIPLDPFRTLAADIGAEKHSDPRFKGRGGLVPVGTKVFIIELAGRTLPDGTIHDGWCTVNDTGGAINGAHFDFFTGSGTLGKKVPLPEICHIWFPQSESRCPPGYSYGLHS